MLKIFCARVVLIAVICALPVATFALPQAGYNEFAAPPANVPQLMNSYENAFPSPAKIIARTAVLEAAWEELLVAKRANVPLPVDYVHAKNRYHGWLAMLEEVRHKPTSQQIAAVNQYINSQPKICEKAGEDVWKLPFDFFRNGGDCEDYAIAKYTSLRWLGVNPDRMRIVIGQDKVTGIYHAALLLYTNSDILVFDNSTDTVFSQAKLTRFKPIYSFNDRKIWYHWYQGDTPPTQYTRYGAETQTGGE